MCWYRLLRRCGRDNLLSLILRYWPYRAEAGFCNTGSDRPSMVDFPALFFPDEGLRDRALLIKYKALPKRLLR